MTEKDTTELTTASEIQVHSDARVMEEQPMAAVSLPQDFKYTPLEEPIAQSSVAMEEVGIQTPLAINQFTIKIATETFGVVEFDMLLGSRDLAFGTAEFKPTVAMVGTTRNVIDDIVKRVYFHHYGPLSEIESDVDLNACIELLKEELHEGAMSESILYKCVGDKTMDPKRQEIHDRLVFKARYVLCGIIRNYMEARPPLAVLDPTGDYEVPDVNPVIEEEIKDDSVYQKTNTEVQTTPGEFGWE